MGPMELVVVLFAVAIVGFWIWIVVRIARVAKENDRNVVGWVLLGIFLTGIAGLILGSKHDDTVLLVAGAAILVLNVMGLLL